MILSNFTCTYWIQNEAGQRLTEFCQKNALVIANSLFQQCKRHIYRWTSPDSQHLNWTDYILCSQRWRSSVQQAKTRLGVDCGSDLELLIVKFRLKLKTVGKTTRPVWCDLNQISYDYTVEVENRFKAVDLIVCLNNCGQWFVTLYRRQWSKTSPRKETQKGKTIAWGGLKNSWKEEKLKAKEKKKDIPIWMQSSKKSRRDTKAFVSEQCKEIKEDNRMGKTRDLFKKIRDSKGIFLQKWAQ